MDGMYFALHVLFMFMADPEITICGLSTERAVRVSVYSKMRIAQVQVLEIITWHTKEYLFKEVFQGIVLWLKL